MTTSPADWADDLINWEAMVEPPVFHTRVVDHDGDDEDDNKSAARKEAAEPAVVATFAEDFEHIASRWATASTIERSTWFWAVGLLHIVEVELVRLPPDLRHEAMARLPDVRRDEPRSAAAQIARIVRELRVAHPEVKFRDRPPMPRADLVTHQRVLAIRACRPYSGPGPDEVRFLHLAAGVLPSEGPT